MVFIKKAAAVGLILATAACTNPDRFGTSGDGAAAGGAGATNGAVTPAQDPTTPVYFAQTVGDRVLFAVDQWTISPTGQQTLAGQAQWLNANPEYRVLIEGHADEQGTKEYNLALGKRRANSVEEVLVSQGVDPNRIQTTSFGKLKPIASCASEECYSQNRRAVTVLSFTGPS